jgi:hypothetical protein
VDCDRFFYSNLLSPVAPALHCFHSLTPTLFLRLDFAPNPDSCSLFVLVESNMDE